jgi:hypothetical protein
MICDKKKKSRSAFPLFVGDWQKAGTRTATNGENGRPARYSDRKKADGKKKETCRLPKPIGNFWRDARI